MNKFLILIFILAIFQPLIVKAQQIRKETAIISYERPPLKKLPEHITSYSVTTNVSGGAYWGNRTKKPYIAEPVFVKTYPSGGKEYKLIERKQDWEEKYFELSGLEKTDEQIADLNVELNIGLFDIHEYKASGNGQKYFSFSFPVNIKAYDSSGNIYFSEEVYPKEKVFRRSINDYKVSILGAGSDQETVLLSQGIVEDAFLYASDYLKSQYFLSKVTKKLPIFYPQQVNLLKKKDYNDLEQAKNLLLNVVNSMNEQGSKTIEHESSIIDCIKLWEEALKKFEPNNKNARINLKVANMIYYNIALSYWVLNEYNKAYNYCTNEIDSPKIKTEIDKLKKILEDSMSRIN